MKNKRFLRRLKKYFLFIGFFVLSFSLFSIKTSAYSGEVIRYQGEPITMIFAIYEDSNYQVRLGDSDDSALLFTIENGIANFYGGRGALIPNVPNLSGWFLSVSCYPDISIETDEYDLQVTFDWFQSLENRDTSSLGSTGWYKYFGFDAFDLRNFYIQEWTENFTSRLIYVVDDSSLNFNTSTLIERVNHSSQFLLDNFNELVSYGYDKGYQEGYNRGTLESEEGDFANFGVVILEMLNNFLSFEILPNFTLLNVLHLCLTIGFVFLILRFFAGG